MAIIWADFPSGQKGIYATQINRMFDGIWSAFENSANGSELVDDPDPNIASEGVVYRVGQGGGTSARGVRFALPAGATTTVGMGFRLWSGGLPGTAWSAASPLFGFRTISNTDIAHLAVQPNGAISAAVTQTGGTPLGTTSTPVVTANSWVHVEIKLTRHASAGEIEVRVNGVVVLDLDTLALGATDVGILFLGHTATAGLPSTYTYYKDVVFWDGTGTEGNDFQGSVAVYDCNLNADIDLNWDPSVAGKTGTDLIADTGPSNILTVSGAITSGNQVRIGTRYHNWTSGSVDAGSPAGTSANPYLVAMGASIAESVENLFLAINASGTPGTNYSTSLTTPHPEVYASDYDGTRVGIMVTDLVTTTGIPCTETGANTSWASSSPTFGPSDMSFISANDTPPDPAKFGLTNLPADAVGVRALLPIVRAVKTDGGDCNIQTGLTPNDTNWDDGADRPITTAFTYYWDVSPLSPATSAPWTPIEVNGAYVRIARTL